MASNLNTSDHPVISVIMPVYNAELYVKEAIDSILNQTFDNFEFIIIDDGSTDESLALIQAYKDPRIIILKNNRNLGNYPTRNLGMRVAKGKYIAVMDADDIALPERFQKQYTFLEANMQTLAIGSNSLIIPNGKERGTPYSSESIRLSLLNNNYILHPSLMIRTSVVHQLRGYKEEYYYAADYDMVCRINLLGDMVCLPDILMHYRWHPDQITQQHRSEQKQFADEIRRNYKEALATNTSHNKQPMRQHTEVTDKDEFLLRIARHLIMHASFTANLGLFHGKMGIVLFFAHYARYTGESVYDEFAGELLDEIYEEIHTAIPVNLENGLCGIGWGVEYLLENGFTEGDSDEVLFEIDKKIMERDLRRVTDLSVNTGLAGILYYVEKRLNSPFRVPNTKPFDDLYLADWEKAKEKIEKSKTENSKILSTLWEKLPEDESITTWSPGIVNGCAGYGLKIMLT